VFTARLEPPTGELTYVDAGHGLSAIVRRSGSVQQLASSAPPIGVLPDSAWQEQAATLGPGDTFITLSDGWLDYFETVPRAAAAAVQIVLESPSAQSIVDQIGGFSSCVTPDDDLTVIAVRRDLS
jgi:serine phosphatase RsbU (regulator of sigma subunit)